MASESVYLFRNLWRERGWRDKGARAMAVGTRLPESPEWPEGHALDQWPRGLELEQEASHLLRQGDPSREPVWTEGSTYISS